jgi:hypothetical protein
LVRTVDGTVYVSTSKAAVNSSADITARLSRAWAVNGAIDILAVRTGVGWLFVTQVTFAVHDLIKAIRLGRHTDKGEKDDYLT